MALFRRRLFDRGLRYSPDLTSYEDWLVYRELHAGGHHGHVIPETLLRYRVRRGLDAARRRDARTRATDGRAASARPGGGGVVDAVERLSLAEAGEPSLIALTHVHRYELAAELCAGMRVLDLCCGSGYGTRILSTTAAAVTGVDKHEASIERAKADLGDRDAISFERGDALEWLERPLAADYDAIVLLEGLEHLPDPGRALEAASPSRRGRADAVRLAAEQQAVSRAEPAPRLGVRLRERAGRVRPASGRPPALPVQCRGLADPLRERRRRSTGG